VLASKTTHGGETDAEAAGGGYFITVVWVC